MARFMDVHSGFTGVTEDQLREAHQRDLDIEAAEGVHFERAWLDPESAPPLAARVVGELLVDQAAEERITHHCCRTAAHRSRKHPHTAIPVSPS